MGKLSESISDACESNTTDGEMVSMFEDPIGHLSVKSILLNESGSSSYNDKISLSSMLCGKYEGKMFESIASSNRVAFVLAAMAKSSKEKVMKEVSSKDIQKKMKACMK